jgi:hypothetical protein
MDMKFGGLLMIFQGKIDAMYTAHTIQDFATVEAPNTA